MQSHSFQASHTQASEKPVAAKTTKRRNIERLALVCLVTLLIAPHTARAGQLFDYLWSPKTLQTVTDGITKRYGGIKHIPTSKLAKQIVAKSGVVIIDVREEAEYRVSHLPGAIRAQPGTGITDVNTLLAASLDGVPLKGKSVVFYCSVGERSSQMAKSMKQSLMSQGAAEVYNLSGGIFAWHNEKRNLVDAQGPTDLVHPFNEQWGRLVERHAMTRMTPKQSNAPQQSTPRPQP